MSCFSITPKVARLTYIADFFWG